MRFDARRFVSDSLRHYWRLNAALALGVAVATAVLTGALLVGDSVRGSLRDTALDRLGKIDVVLAGEHFFRETLATELAADPTVNQKFAAIVPGVLLPATLERPEAGGRPARRLGGAQAIGAPPEFWNLGDAALVEPPSEPGAKIVAPNVGEIVLNAEAAAGLEAHVGDEVLLRLPEIIQLPRDSAFAHKTDSVRSVRLKLVEIVASTGLGRFGLNPSQEIPRLAYVETRTIQNALEQYESARKLGFVNALFVAGRDGATPTLADAETLANAIKPTLEDYGLKVAAEPRGYLLISSNRMLIDPPAVRTIEALTKPEDRQEVLTYLADALVAGSGDARRESAYATVAAIDFREAAPFGPFVDDEGKPLAPLDSGTSQPPYPIALTRWAADELKANVGDEITLDYFPPEGAATKQTVKSEKFRVASIVALRDAADDRRLTPDFPGITDSLTIGDWDAPFEFDESRVKPQDEEYWEKHKATPKAYVPLAVGRKLWTSRFGDVSGVRIRPPAGDASPDRAASDFAEKLRAALDPRAMGFAFQPVKAQQLAAAGGSTPFDALFLGFSFFLIAAAVMLAGLLFRLNVETRAHELGVLLASGVTLARARRLLAAEGVAVALLGGALGVALGIGYAWLMIFALRSPALWLAAVGVPFLELHVSPLSLVLGLAIGVIVCGAAIWVGTWSLDKTPVRRLLAGRTDDEAELVAPPSAWTMWLGAALAVTAAALVPFAATLSGLAQAGAFFGAGAALLAGGLIFLRGRLRGGRTGALIGRTAPAFRLAMRNVARNPGRSVLTIGLVAAATFLIVAMSAFHIDPSLIGPDKNSGNGGFYFVAESDQPVFVDLNDHQSPEGQEKLNISPEEAATLEGVRVYACRVRPGDDASCLNLYQPRQPRVLGLPRDFLERGGFAWAGVDAPSASPAAKENPWRILLAEQAPDGGSTPVVLDFATAQYGLKVGLGSGLPLRNDDGTERPVRVAGLLDNSVLQGDVLMGEAAFEARFPGRSGRQFFLIEVPLQPADTLEKRAAAVAEVYERSLGDLGFTTEKASDRLARFLAVQNTYLVTFQSLGGLGLLLGAFGVAAVQLRNVLERRRELALMQAVGFRKSWLARMVFWETLVLLAGGLVVGAIAAALAISPQLASSAASIPWLTLGVLLALVVVCGFVAGTLAVRATLRLPVVQTLRD